MDIRRILSMLRKKWPFIVILSIAGALALYIYSSLAVTPIYAAKATMIVNKSQYQAAEQNQMSYSDILLTQKLVKSYTIIMMSDTNLELVKKDLNLNIPVSDIKSFIKISAVGETEVLQITVEHEDAVLAQQIANSLVKVSPPTIIRVIKAGSAEVIDTAKTPDKPVKPVVWQYVLLGAFLGLIFAVAIIFLRDFFDNTFKTEDDVRNALDLPVITSLPEIAKDGVKIITGETPFDYREAFKVLRTKIQFSAVDGKMKKIAVTSSGPSEGKTTVAINLALSIAEAGQRVLLIDADMRKGYLHDLLNMSGSTGLAEVLADSKQLFTAIQPTNISGLDFLARGETPNNPSELLLGDSFKDILKLAGEQYDFVIMDTPPVLAVSDATVIGQFAGTTLLVIRADNTTPKELENCIVSFTGSNIEPAGVVLNGVQYSARINQAYEAYTSNK